VNVTIENLAACKKRVRVDVPAAKVDETLEEVVSAFQREAKLPGFRPGKVPKTVILKNFGKAVEEEARKKLLNESYKEAIRTHKLHVAGSVDIEDVKFAKGQDFQYTATLETAPEFELPEYKGLRVKRELRTVTEEDITRALDVLRDRTASFQDVNRPAKEGDFVVVNYTGTSEGKPLTDFAPTARGLTQQTGFWIEVKPGSFIPGFTEQLVGASKGEKRTVNVDFPQEFVAPQLAGKKGTYEVEIVEVKEKTLPPLDDAFAKSYNAESLEKLREGVRRDLQNELDLKITRSLRNQVVEALSRQVQCELPESLVADQTKHVIYDIVLENQQRGISKEKIDEQKDEIFNYAQHNAKERLKVSFLLGRVAEKENIRVEQDELLREIHSIAEQRGEKVEKILRDLQKNNGLNHIHERLLVGKVIDFLQQHATIEDVQPQPQ
jgi:trigger factor